MNPGLPMNDSQIMWNAINTVGLAIIAVIGLISNRLAAKAVVAASKNTESIKEVAKTVNGPLSHALQTAVIATEKLAQVTQEPTDIKAASDAKAVLENRILGHPLAAESLTKETEQT